MSERISAYLQSFFRSPLGQAAGAAIGLVVLVAAFFLGLFFLAIVAGLALIGGTLVAVRIWWLRQRLERELAQRSTRAGTSVIEGEYIIVEKKRRDNDRSP